jgi:hypothetical protein
MNNQEQVTTPFDWAAAVVVARGQLSGGNVDCDNQHHKPHAFRTW